MLNALMMITATCVLESAQFIASNSQHVTIPPEGIKTAAASILSGMEQTRYSTSTWSEHPLNPKSKTRQTVDWIFLVDTLNFSFWSSSTNDTSSNQLPYTVTYQNKSWTGYWSLCAAINRALDSGIPVTDAKWMAQVEYDVFREIFKSDNGVEMPLLRERYDIVRYTGKVLCEKWNCSFVNCVEAAGKSAVKLIQILIEDFPSFRDWSTFKGRTVFFLKRAQILVADLWASFQGQSFGSFHDINDITMFADYRVPQSLQAIGALSYSQVLLERLERDDQGIRPGDEIEVEIRGCSIHAVELIRREIVSILERRRVENGNYMKRIDDSQINAILIDFYLWDYAKKYGEEIKEYPIHKLRTIYY